MSSGRSFWAASDVGWVVGHSYIVYAPLFNGMHPPSSTKENNRDTGSGASGASFRNMEFPFVHGSTAFRAIKKEDPTATI